MTTHHRDTELATIAAGDMDRARCRRTNRLQARLRVSPARHTNIKPRVDIHLVLCQPCIDGLKIGPTVCHCGHPILGSAKRGAPALLRGSVAERWEMVDYPRALASGSDIGWGPTEAMCTNLTLGLKRTGMKLDPSNAAAVMNLGSYANPLNGTAGGPTPQPDATNDRPHPHRVRPPGRRDAVRLYPAEVIAQNRTQTRRGQ